MEFWKKTKNKKSTTLGALEKNHEEEDNNFGSFGKIQEEEDNGFEGMAKKKMVALGALQKTMKNKTTTLMFRLQRRRP
jgi:hypothetical protein